MQNHRYRICSKYDNGDFIFNINPTNTESQRNNFIRNYCDFVRQDKDNRTARATSGDGAAGDSPLKCEAFQNFRNAKIWLRPCGRAVIVKGTFLTDRVVQPCWENKHNYTLHKPMGTANVTNENT